MWDGDTYVCIVCLQHLVCRQSSTSCNYVDVNVVQDEAYEKNQKYKEGKFILERATICMTSKSYDVFPTSRLDDTDSDGE
jgi:hypothetical protein